MSGGISNKATFFPANSAPATLHVGPGALYRVIATTASADQQTLTFYDGVGTGAEVLLKVNVSSSHPLILQMHDSLPVRFAFGLTIDPSGCDVHLAVMV